MTSNADLMPLETSQLVSLAALVERDYLRLREAVPALPAGALSRARVEPLLGQIVGRQPGVTAVRDGAFAGGIGCLMVEGLFGSGSAAYVPDWACAIDGPDRSRTFTELYRSIAAEWVDRGWGVHCFTVSAADTELIETLTWLGFGMRVVDAVRDLEPRPAPAPAGVALGPAAIEDLPHLLPLALGHAAYYATAPTFLYCDRDESPEAEMARWLTTPGESVWVARAPDRILSFLYLCPPGADVCLAVRDEGTISINGAFTVPDARASGVAGALLEAAVAWARTAGFERMSVDFESPNSLARRFWLRTFQPVCVSLARHIDDRLVAAEAVR